MRITDSMVYTRSLQQLQDQFSELNVASAQVSTGQRNAQMSDDPLAGDQVMQTDAALRGITQYRRNITSVRSSLNGEESTLDQIGDLLNRAKELATEQGGDTANASSRAAAGAEVQSLLAQAISLGNLKIGDQYVFGGTQTGTAPFLSDGTYVGDTTVRQTQIDDSTTVNTTHTGAQLLVDSGVIQSLKTLATAMNGNDPAGIRGVISNIDTAFDQTQTSLAEVGAGTNQLDAAGTNFDTRQASLTAQRSALAEIPLEEASLHLATVQNALQAGLLATSRILNTNLVTYLQ